MGKKEITPGTRFGTLTVVRPGPSYGTNRSSTSVCKCDCGNEKIVLNANLKAGTTLSCGCYRKSDDFRMKHSSAKYKGESMTRLGRIHRRMIARCSNPKSSDWKWYGGKGITVCVKWSSYSEFKKWAEKTGYHDGLTIDRIDSSKGYCPSNCRWVDMIEQNNSKTTNNWITFKGKTMTMKQWSNHTGIGYSTLRNRINVYKWSVDCALTVPVDRRKSKC